ncbi:MAG: CheR family methyltransferase [Geminicoccaceae bacterium]
MPTSPRELDDAPVRYQVESVNKSSTHLRMSVVGIGASAGSVDALERFFERMPPDSGCAFIVVQHPTQQYPTHMDGILQRKTMMPVKIAAQGVGLEANTVYVGPPGQVVEVEGDTIVLHDSDRSAVPISTISALFRSLARSQGQSAIVVVLSGTGSDGTDGLREVRRARGTIIVQDSVTAGLDGMPKSVIVAGVFDFILAPDQMPDAIRMIVNDRMPPDASNLMGPLEEHKVQEILDLLEDTYQVDFARYKQSTIIRRIQRRLELGQTLSLADYHEQLSTSPDELDLLYRNMLIGVTQFFRDPRHFEALETAVLPDLIEKAAEKGEIRIWITACASGEEAYSIAMLLDEQISKLASPPTVRFFATDIHPGALETASRGLYKREAISDLSPERLQRYFVRDGEDYQIAPWLRQSILFSQHNILRDPPFTQIDLVTCRNLLIYFDRPTQDNAIARMHFSLRLGGAMFLGNGERVGRYEDEFDLIASDARLYRKKRDVELIRIDGAKLPRMTVEHRKPSNARKTPSAAMHKAYDALLQRLSYNGFLIADSGKIEHTLGEAGRLLQMSGVAQLNLFELIPSDLRAAVQTTLLRAKSADSPQISGTVGMCFPGEDPKRLRVQVEPMPECSPGVRLFLVRLTESISDSELAEVSDPSLSESKRSENAWLRGELEVAQDGLERLVQGLGARNDELQASNEELTASNEELQSTNEELQSVNEELHAINNEHERTITELQTLTHDMETTLNGIDVGVLFIDTEATIRSLTFKVKEFFGLSDNDINRPIDEIGSRFGIQDLQAKISQVEKEEASIEQLARNRTGDLFLMRVLPKLEPFGKITGNLLIFMDVEQLWRKLKACKGAPTRPN